MEDRLIVTASPHIREASTTRGLMGNVVIALLPAVIAAGLIFGVQALVFLRLPGLLGFQGASAALDTCRRGGKDQIPAHRTDIEYGVFHISSLRGIFGEIRCEQAFGADPQSRCQR